MLLSHVTFLVLIKCPNKDRTTWTRTIQLTHKMHYWKKIWLAGIIFFALFILVLEQKQSNSAIQRHPTRQKSERKKFVHNKNNIIIICKVTCLSRSKNDEEGINLLHFASFQISNLFFCSYNTKHGQIIRLPYINFIFDSWLVCLSVVIIVVISIIEQHFWMFFGAESRHTTLH